MTPDQLQAMRVGYRYARRFGSLMLEINLADRRPWLDAVPYLAGAAVAERDRLDRKVLAGNVARYRGGRRLPD